MRRRVIVALTLLLVLLEILFWRAPWTRRKRRKDAKARSGCGDLASFGDQRFERLLLLRCVFALIAFAAQVTAATNLTTISELGAAHAEPLRLQIAIGRSDVEALRREPRQYVMARIKEGATEFTNVAVHLKGAIGSFRPIDDKPSFTLNFSRHVSNRTFHGSSKIHLNNSVEDPSYLNEKIGTVIFAKAGIPASAVHHALVELNGRRLGLYVLKEGFTAEFLARNFNGASGNLYDTDTGHEITDNLQRDLGSGPDDRRDLKQLAEIANLADPNERWKRLPEMLDVDKFLSFMATEIMVCHRDGYCLARNNYRLFRPDEGRFVFLPHGMDQLFQRTNFPWHPSMAGLLAQVVIKEPEGANLYRQRLESLVTNAFDPAALSKEIDQTVTALSGVLPRSEAASIQGAARDLKMKIVQRKGYLEKELSKPIVTPINFANGPFTLNEWRPANLQQSGTLDSEPAPDGTASLHIRATNSTEASWRQSVLLQPGLYRVEGRAMTQGISPITFAKRSGACIRALGHPIPQQPALTGTHAWMSLAAEFTVSGETQEVELLCELRASKGEVWFDRGSLKLIRLFQIQPRMDTNKHE
jgi:spore coat protein H